jgi:hypothetical protein
LAQIWTLYVRSGRAWQRPWCRNGRPFREGDGHRPGVSAARAASLVSSREHLPSAFQTSMIFGMPLLRTLQFGMSAFTAGECAVPVWVRRVRAAPAWATSYEVGVVSFRARLPHNGAASETHAEDYMTGKGGMVCSWSLALGMILLGCSSGNSGGAAGSGGSAGGGGTSPARSSV